MKEKLDELENRISVIENFNNNIFEEMEELEFLISEPVVKNIQTLTINSSGNFRYWRELNIPEGMTRYSNWSVNVKIKDGNSQPVVCDWITLSNCNHKIKQARTVTEKSGINFTTPKTKGWSSITFDVQIKHNGSIYNKVSVKLKR